jgi:hypothetical protein
LRLSGTWLFLVFEIAVFGLAFVDGAISECVDGQS